MDTKAEPALGITLRCGACGKWNRVRAERAGAGPKCGACAAALDLARPIPLDDATFDRTIAGTDVPVLVDFYADWCGPCHMMAPAIDALARESVGRAVIAKLDTDAAPRTAARFQIRGIPTSIVFRNGLEVRRQTGAASLPTLRSLIA